MYVYWGVEVGGVFGLGEWCGWFSLFFVGGCCKY